MGLRYMFVNLGNVGAIDGTLFEKSYRVKPEGFLFDFLDHFTDNIKMEEESRAGRRKQQVNFNDDLEHMLYAFGDSKKPEQDTVDALQEYLVFFMDKIIEKSLGRA